MKVRAFAIVLAAILFATAPAARSAVSGHVRCIPTSWRTKKPGVASGDGPRTVRLVTMYTCPVHAVIEQAKRAMPKFAPAISSK